MHASMASTCLVSIIMQSIISMIVTSSFPPCTIAICPRGGKLLRYEFHYILHFLAGILAEAYYAIDTILYWPRSEYQ